MTGNVLGFRYSLKCTRAREEIRALVQEENKWKYFLRDQRFFNVVSCWHRNLCRFSFVSMMSTNVVAINVTARNISMLPA